MNGQSYSFFLNIAFLLCQTFRVVLISKYLFYLLTSFEVCNGTPSATHMECWTPVFQEEMPEEKSDIGELCIHMDGGSNLWKKRFDYHPDPLVIPFENDDNILLLKPGETEVSLHVCLHTLTLFFFPTCIYVTSLRHLHANLNNSNTCITKLLIDVHSSVYYSIQNANYQLSFNI